MSYGEKCGKYFKNTQNRCKPKQDKKKQQIQKQAKKLQGLQKEKKTVYAPPSPVLSTRPRSIEESVSRRADDDSSSEAVCEGSQ